MGVDEKSSWVQVCWMRVEFSKVWFSVILDGFAGSDTWREMAGLHLWINKCRKASLDVLGVRGSSFLSAADRLCLQLVIFRFLRFCWT